MFTKPKDMLYLKFTTKKAKRDKICGSFVNLNYLTL